MQRPTLLFLFFILINLPLSSQVNENQLGAWYMYFWNMNFNSNSRWGKFGIQGDQQLRNWNVAGDLEQLLLRGGITYVPPKMKVKFTAGYGFIASGTPGSDKSTSPESRIYQEALLNQKAGPRFFLNHRFRFEERFVQGQDFRTRGRYNLFLFVPVNCRDLNRGSIYLALYNELFINGQRNIGNGRTVEIFDRNRIYGAVGYSIRDNIKVQAGYMRQITDNWSKGQLQLSLHQTINFQ